MSGRLREWLRHAGGTEMLQVDCLGRCAGSDRSVVRGARRARIVAFLGVLAGVAAVAGCSSSSSSSSQRAPSSPSFGAQAASTVRAAGPATLAAGSAELTIHLTATNPPPAGGKAGTGSQSSNVALEGTISGPYDFSSGDGQLTIELSGTVAQLLGGPLQVTFANGTAYFVPRGTLANVVQLAPGKTYASITLQQLAQVLNFGPLGSALAGNVGQLFELFDTPVLRAAKLGTSSVDGVPATEYLVDVDVAQAAAAGGPAASIYSAIQHAASGLKTLQEHVWVDSAGRIRQIQVTLTGLQASLAWQQGASLALTVSFGQLGVPVQVSVPPPNEVQPITNLP
jgi:hypothetical protein